MAQRGQKRPLARRPTIDENDAREAINKSMAMHLQAEAFHRGDLLQQLATEQVAQFRQVSSKLPWGTLRGRQTWGSLCSGSEGAHFVVAAIQSALQASRGELESTSQGEGTAIGQDSSEAMAKDPSEELLFDQCFACESNAQKRTWIDRVVNTQRRKDGKPLVCVFDDITKMHTQTAYCCAHEKRCPIPDVTFLFVSTSCKDLSSLSNNKPSTKPVLGKLTSPGGSADTFRGFLSYLDSHSCKIIFYENSDNLEDTGTASGKVGNHDVFMSELTSRSYESQGMLLNARMFGLPQSRRRFFSVHVKVEDHKHSHVDFTGRSVVDMFKTLTYLLSMCQREPPCASEILLQTRHPAVEAELLRRSSEPSTATGQGYLREHQKLYESLRLSVGAQAPFASTSSSPWYSTLLPAQRSALVLHQYQLLSALPPAGGIVPRTASSQARAQIGAVPGMRLMVDVFPSGGRLVASTVKDNNKHCCPCICPHSMLWLHGADSEERLMLGRESLLMQGWPILQQPYADEFSNKFLQDLAGNAIALPVLLAVAISTLCSLCWKQAAASGQEAEERRQACEDAMAIMLRQVAGASSSSGESCERS